MRRLFTPIHRDSQTHAHPHPHPHTQSLQFAIVLWQPLLKSVSFSPSLRLSFISCCFSASLSSSSASASASSLKVAWPGTVPISGCLTVYLSVSLPLCPFLFSSPRWLRFRFAFFLFGVVFALKWFWHLSYFPCVDFCVSSTHFALSPAPPPSSSAIGCWSCSPLQELFFSYSFFPQLWQDLQLKWQELQFLALFFRLFFDPRLHSLALSLYFFVAFASFICLLLLLLAVVILFIKLNVIGVWVRTTTATRPSQLKCTFVDFSVCVIVYVCACVFVLSIWQHSLRICYLSFGHIVVLPSWARGCSTVCRQNMLTIQTH